MRLKLFALLLFLPSFSHAADANLMISIIECESSGRFNAVGDGGLSHGIAQFRRDTFYEFASLAKMKGMRWKNPIHQMRVMNWALDNGYGRRWTCYRKLTKTGEFKAS